MTHPAPLFGLVLAGGQSSRMQSDKARLEYHGKPQLHWAMELLVPLCEQVFVSVRPEQRQDPVRAALPQIVDRLSGLGPIAGIVAAQEHAPQAAWLVVACDLPFLNAPTLQFLCAHRSPEQHATAFRSAHDGLPEPLCAIWEPSSHAPVLAFIAGGRTCPRKFMLTHPVAVLEQPDPQALDNVNTPEEFLEATQSLQRRSPDLVQAG